MILHHFASLTHCTFVSVTNHTIQY